MGAHLVEGQFQSDKYPSTPRGKVPLSCKDPMAQDLLWAYAQRRRRVDAEFSADLEHALTIAGYVPPPPGVIKLDGPVTPERIAAIRQDFLMAYGGAGPSLGERVCAWLRRRVRS